MKSYMSTKVVNFIIAEKEERTFKSTFFLFGMNCIHQKKCRSNFLLVHIFDDFGAQ